MFFQERGYGGMNWIDLAQSRDSRRDLVGGSDPSGSIKCGEFLDLLRIGRLVKKDSCFMDLVTD
jgi:hypothetical protein